MASPSRSNKGAVATAALYWVSCALLSIQPPSAESSAAVTATAPTAPITTTTTAPTAPTAPTAGPSATATATATFIDGAAGTVSVWLMPQSTGTRNAAQYVADFRGLNPAPAPVPAPAPAPTSAPPPPLAPPSAPTRGRLVISRDRTHDPRFYVALDDHRSLACSPRFRFPYTFFLPGRWTQIVVTWQSGHPGMSRWFVDGKILCEAGVNFAAEGGNPNPHGAAPPAANMQLDRLITADRAWSAEEVHRSYMENGGDARAKWLIALGSDPAVAPEFMPSPEPLPATESLPAARPLPSPEPPPAREHLSTHEPLPAPHERRVMQDEDTHWAASKTEILRRLQRIQEAGFNVYMPNVWNGAQMFCISGVAPMSPSIRDALDPHYDPLNYLIAEAHKRGIEVHPWIYVVGRQPSEGFPAAFLDGSPAGAFNVHSLEFRDFLVALAVDIARRHDIDGLNLDYIRAVGPCTNAACLDAYRQKYGRSLADDWNISARGTSVPSVVEFNRDAVTDIVARIASGVRALRPHAILTVDSVLFDYSRSQQGLDEESWIKRGLIDAVVNMSYDDPVDIDSLDRAISTLGARRLVVTFRNYDLFGGDVRDRSGVAMADYVRLVRRRWPGAGIGVYHYMHMDPDQLAGFRNLFSSAIPPTGTD